MEKIKVGDLLTYTNRHDKMLTALVLEIDGRDILCFVRGETMWFDQGTVEAIIGKKLGL